MSTLSAQVRQGRLLLDEPTDLPDGTEVELVQVDARDDLDAAERQRLHSALERSEGDGNDGRVRPFESVLVDLRRI